MLLLARHFDQQIEDFTVIQNDVVAQIRLAGISSPDIFRERMATPEWHEMLRSRGRRILLRRRHQCVRFGGSADQFVRKLAGPKVNVADRAYFNALKSERRPRRFWSNWCRAVSPGPGPPSSPVR